MRLLVTGRTGYVGTQLVAQASAAGHDVVATSRRPCGLSSGEGPSCGSSSGEGRGAYRDLGPSCGSSSGEGRVAYRDPGPSMVRLDITDAAACRAVIAEVAPDVVIHAAYDYRDWRVTADGAVHVALAAAAFRAHLVFVSSDSIFSGRAPSYDEQAAPDPITPYGAAKAAAETAIRAVSPTATIARSSLVLGPDSAMERLVHDLAGGADGALFADDIRCPVHRDDLAAALLELAELRPAGVVHCGGAGAVSRADIGRLIAARDGLDFDRIRIGSRAQLGPDQQLEVRLDSRHTQGLLRTRLRGAREFLAAQPSESTIA